MHLLGSVSHLSSISLLLHCICRLLQFSVSRLLLGSTCFPSPFSCSGITFYIFYCVFCSLSLRLPASKIFSLYFTWLLLVILQHIFFLCNPFQYSAFRVTDICKFFRYLVFRVTDLCSLCSRFSCYVSHVSIGSFSSLTKLNYYILSLSSLFLKVCLLSVLRLYITRWYMLH